MQGLDHSADVGEILTAATLFIELEAGTMRGREENIHVGANPSALAASRLAAFHMDLAEAKQVR